MKISVVIPSFRRPAELAACLEALAQQQLAAFEVLIVLRPQDDAGRASAASASIKPRIVTVQEPGQVAALNRGCSEARGEIIALTDDDARPRPEWLAGIAARFATDARIGAVGGRDVVHLQSGIDDGKVAMVGRVRWWGRRIGNHHYNSVLQDVDFLKGANMAFRAVARQPFDERLWGTGAQVCNDLEATWSVKRRGWRVVYDPAIVVDHFPASRHDEDGRGRRSPSAEQAEQHNELYALMRHAPAWQQAVLFAYRLLVGSRQAPGLGLAMVPGVGRCGRTRAVGLARARFVALRTLRGAARST